MKKILLVGHGNWIVKKYIVEELKELKYYIVLLTPRDDPEINSMFDKVIVDDCRDYTRLMKIIDEESAICAFDGIMGYDEVKIPIVNDISRHLNLPVVTNYDSEAYRYKDRMRFIWESNKIACPHYKVLNSIKEIHKLCDMKYPIILKPTSYLSSIGVRKVDSFELLYECAREVFEADLYYRDGKDLCSMREQYNLSNSIIAEEFVGGEEYSAEGYSIDGVYHLLGITKKFTISDNYFDEIGHVFPAKLAGIQVEKINDVLDRAHRALGISNSFTHTEFKLYNGKVYPIEIGARLSGDYIPKLMKLSGGVSPIEYAVKCRTNERIDIDFHASATFFGIWFINAPKSSYGKKFVKIDVDSLKQSESFVEYESYYESGRKIEAPCFCGLERVGHVIFKTNEYENINNIIEEIKEKVNIVFDGN